MNLKPFRQKFFLVFYFLFSFLFVSSLGMAHIKASLDSEHTHSLLRGSHFHDANSPEFRLSPLLLPENHGDKFEKFVASTVALYAIEKPSSSAIANFCSGTLVAPSVILTAAHCLVDVPHQFLNMSQEEFTPKVLVGFGSQLAKSYKDKRVRFIKVRKVLLHPHYVEGQIPQAMKIPLPDLALLLLEEPAPETFFPVRLGTNPQLLAEGREMILAGFGITSSTWEIIPNHLSKVKVTIDNPHLTSAQFSYKIQNGQSTCFGDSGGPAFFEIENSEFVVGGVTSWGDGNCAMMGAYTSVPAFKEFLTGSLKLLTDETLSQAPPFDESGIQ